MESVQWSLWSGVCGVEFMELRTNERLEVNIKNADHVLPIV